MIHLLLKINNVKNRKADEDEYFLKAYENPQDFFETIELIASAGQEHKTDVVRILMRHLNVSPEQVMFVDDMQATLDILNYNTGIIGVHLSKVKDLKKSMVIHYWNIWMIKEE